MRFPLAVIVQTIRTLNNKSLHALQTVPAASVTAVAKPIKEQKVDKEKVWLIFILGAAGLFGGTLLLENNERFFPAIYKANLAMSQAKKAMKVSSTRLPLLKDRAVVHACVHVRLTGRIKHIATCDL